MINYIVDPDILHPLVPRGTQLDYWNGSAYVSVVGFLFLNTYVRGVPIPFHTNFEEVNLRFYVRREAEDGRRRGVVFIRELVPRRMTAWLARLLYNEKYSFAKMRHDIRRNKHGSAEEVTYSWSYKRRPGAIRLSLNEAPVPMTAGSEEEFITEHYWGYAAQRDGGTTEYRVAHPRWNACAAASASFECDIAHLYGAPFVEPLSRAPASAFLADGSAVEVYQGVKLA